MPSALWMEMENNRFWGGLRPLFKTPGNQHPGGGTAGAGSRILSGHTRDVGETPPPKQSSPCNLRKAQGKTPDNCDLHLEE